MPDEKVPVSKKRGWRVYFWLVTVLFGVLLVAEFIEPGDDTVADAVDSATWGFSLIGVFGFAYSRAILSQRLWQIWLPIVVVKDLFILSRQFSTGHIELETATFAFIAVISVIVFIPEYIALYRYGYQSETLWHAER
jgi:hypothetical protein